MGSRRRLILLHGLAGHGGEWAATAAALGDRFDVIAPDLPGHGGDGLPPLDAPTILAGQSYGGLLAMRLAANHAETWVAGLDDQLRPRWDADDLQRRLGEAVERATWETWERIACPILVVRGEHGSLPQPVADEMVARNPRAEVVTLPGGHDVHLDSPEAWQRVLTAAVDRAP